MNLSHREEPDGIRLGTTAATNLPVASSGSFLPPSVSTTAVALPLVVASAGAEDASLVLLAGLLPAPSDSGGGPEGVEVRQVALRSNDLVYNPHDGYIYASVASLAGCGIGNTIAAVNPITASVDGAVFIGSEPTKLAISDNGQYLYADLQGAAAIRRFDLTTWEAGLQFPLTPGGRGFSWVEDLQVQPGNANVVAVSRRNRCCSPRHEGVTIYVDGTPLPQQTPGHTGSNVIEFGDIPGRLYGYNTETTEFGFRRMDIDQQGVRVADVVRSPHYDFSLSIVYDWGLLYWNVGPILEPESRLLVGTYAGLIRTSQIRPDATLGWTLAVTGSVLQIYDQATYVPIIGFNLPGVGGPSDNLIGWFGGLAFRNNNRLVLVDFF